MTASSPSTINGKTYDKYALSLIVSGSYTPEGKPEASIVCNLTPLRIEDGVVDTQPAEARSIRVGSLEHADANMLEAVAAIQTALQKFIIAGGY